MFKNLPQILLELKFLNLSFIMTVYFSGMLENKGHKQDGFTLILLPAKKIQILGKILL